LGAGRALLRYECAQRQAYALGLRPVAEVEEPIVRRDPPVRRNPWLALALIAVATLVAYMQLGSYAFDRRPTHFDEWRNVGLARRAIASGTIAHEPPVGSPDGLARDIADRNRETAYVALLAGWILLTGDPVAETKVLVLAFLLLYTLGVYFLARAIGARPFAALAAAAFVGTLPSNLLILGPAYAVPSSASLGFLALALVAHQRLSERPATSGRWTLLAAGSILILALVYPFSLLVFGLVVGVDLLVRPGLHTRWYATSLVLIGCILAVAVVGLEWQGSAGETARHLSHLLIVHKRWHLLKVFTLPLANLFSFPLLALATVGSIVCLRRRETLWIAALLLAPLASWAAYELIGASLVVPYQRVGAYLGFGACLCGGVGLDRVVRVLQEWRAPSWLPVGVAVALVLLVFALPRVFAFPRPSREFTYLERIHRPDSTTREVLAWIGEHYRPPARVYTEPKLSTFVEALTGLRAAPVSLDAHLSARSLPPFDCQAEWEIVVGRIDCAGYREVFRSAWPRVFERRSEADAGDAFQ
jgi:hypothetical protein